MPLMMDDVDVMRFLIKMRTSVTSFGGAVSPFTAGRMNVL